MQRRCCVSLNSKARSMPKIKNYLMGCVDYLPESPAASKRGRLDDCSEPHSQQTEGTSTTKRETHDLVTTRASS
jgi:hypothetical protein